MKTKIIPNIALLSFCMLFLFSCEDTTYKEYTGNAPLYMTYTELRDAINIDKSVDLKNPGKIYFKDNFIFIIEELKGIHVFDNSNPAVPVKKAFIRIPGAIDMAISGNILYADSFVDLVAIDVSDIDNIHEAGRINDILPYTIPPTENELPIGYVDKDKGLVVGWEVKTIRERVYNNNIIYPIFRMEKDAFLLGASSSFSSSGVSSSGIGVGGSMARIGIKENTLYLLDGNNMNLFDITTKSAPALLYETNLGWGIETMFLTKNNMFLGTTTGMLIYDITDPQVLIRKSSYSHMRSCDPVVVDDTLAYITLRSGTNCGGTVNSLDVVNIKNLSQPAIVRTYPMNNPYGLGKDGNILFICDGSAGLKVFEASNPKSISNIYTYPNIKAFDVIPLGDILILIGDDGLFQYNYSNYKNITLLSSILVNKD